MSFEPEHITDRVICVDNDNSKEVSFIRVSEIVWARYKRRVVNLGASQQKNMYEVEALLKNGHTPTIAFVDDETRANDIACKYTVLSEALNNSDYK